LFTLNISRHTNCTIDLIQLSLTSVSNIYTTVSGLNSENRGINDLQHEAINSISHLGS